DAARRRAGGERAYSANPWERRSSSTSRSASIVELDTEEHFLHADAEARAEPVARASRADVGPKQNVEVAPLTLEAQRLASQPFARRAALRDEVDAARRGHVLRRERDVQAAFLRLRVDVGGGDDFARAIPEQDLLRGGRVRCCARKLGKDERREDRVYAS